MEDKKKILMQDAKNIREKILEYFKGRFTGQDLSEIVDYFCDDRNEKDLKSLLSGHFDEILSDQETISKNLDHILYRIHYDINVKAAERSHSSFDTICRWSLRVAGILIIPAILFLFQRIHRDNMIANQTWVEIKAPAWTRVQFNLPDGTTGWLNSNSTLRYNGNYLSDRHLKLNGEAFFDVSGDPGHPFIVEAGDLSVRAVGTRFNVASYDEESEAEIVLDEGKLMINRRNDERSLEMNPSDLVIYNKMNGDFITEQVQSQKYTSWKEGKLVFRNDPLDVVGRRLERWYNIDVEVKGDISADLRLRATFVDESLEEVLYLLKCSLPISYEIIGRGMSGDNIYSRKKVIINLTN